MLKIGSEKVYTQSEIMENIRAYGKSIITACPGLPDRDIAVVLSVALGEDVEFVHGRICSAFKPK